MCSYALYLSMCYHVLLKLLQFNVGGYNFFKLHGNLDGGDPCTEKLSFPLRISSVNVTKSAVFCGFGHIY